MTIPAKAEFIVLCRLALTGLARARAVEPDLIADLKLALTEACTNAIRHAYGHEDGQVKVFYMLADDSLSVEVVDEGAGFDPEAAGGYAEEISSLEGGLGIAIIRALVDELEIGSSPQGSRLRFVKQLVPT